jgi:uncharacterized protein YjeT (DUF2065 family)
MPSELWLALCLVAVLEGLFLFAAPGAWKRAAERIQALPDRQVRVVGAVMVALGLACLWLLRARAG